ncbi:MAG: hypothetical protein HC838_06795 [Spirulinaceae cyanobacterium RM2_2_10]|nr:hypothetical protein [Spirulinaceae cyanobacterium RM2_2_10]
MTARWNCRGGGGVAAWQQAIDQARAVESGSPLYSEAQARIQEWSDDIQAEADRDLLSRADALATAGNTRQAIDAAADRLAALGFNLVRSWDNFDPTQPYQVGDGSVQDIFAYSCAAFEKRGIKLWVPQFNQTGKITETDVGVLDSPADAEAWKEAIREWNTKEPKSIRDSKFYVHDPRTAAPAPATDESLR